jgi:hypothetical protein
METTNETQFVALYQGKTVNEARVVAVSADRQYVDRFLDMLPGEASKGTERQPSLRLVPKPEPDPLNAA